ncbi:unnamed protein product, partial [Mesorhabditis belari]|uniref:ShKT domain-containing protein n=1 Tax=Mesorhabditis belari TaxID=2138241 RepID=A0AAF3FMM2_9BILA
MMRLFVLLGLLTVSINAVTYCAVNNGISCNAVCSSGFTCAYTSTAATARVCCTSANLRTATTSCYNRGTDCAARRAAGYCSRTYYVTLMRTQCPLACGFCSTGK